MCKYSLKRDSNCLILSSFVEELPDDDEGGVGSGFFDTAV